MPRGAMLSMKNKFPGMTTDSSGCLQVALPAGGARLLMGSKSFWESIPLKQSVKSVRCKPAREAPPALQRVAMKEPGKAQPTIFVADLLPVGPPHATQLDFQLMKKQVCHSMEHLSLSVYVSVSLRSWLCMFACLFVSLGICADVCLSVCLSVCLNL